MVFSRVFAYAGFQTCPRSGPVFDPLACTIQIQNGSTFSFEIRCAVRFVLHAFGRGDVYLDIASPIFRDLHVRDIHGKPPVRQTKK